MKAALTAALFLVNGLAGAATLPNIVLIYADDLGYGDVSSYGSGKLQTPHLDQLAGQGVRFSDAHSSSATCTPSRYSLMTGEYAWRKRGTNVLPGDAASLITPGRNTLPIILKRAGYATGAVGKWHLGLGVASGPDWNGRIQPSPNDLGFDYSFIMAATGDRVPTVYVENGRVVELDPSDPIRVSYGRPLDDGPTGAPQRLKMLPSHGHDQAIVNGISRIGYMTGGQAARWKDEDMSDTFTARALHFIGDHRAQPFFLYLAMHEPHVPRAPHPRFVGKSGLGARGDAILQLDANVGAVLATLDRLELADNTLVIVSSDNGPVVDDGYRDESIERLGAHRPGGPWRGGKYSNFEAATRVPLLVRWPARIKPGTSHALVSQVDLLATLAQLTEQPVDRRDAPDSQPQLRAWLGRDRRGRSELVEHAQSLALRQGRWKYIAPGGGAKVDANTHIELGNDNAPQLYNLQRDPGETTNLAARHPKRTRTMAAALQRIRQQDAKP